MQIKKLLHPGKKGKAAEKKKDENLSMTPVPEEMYRIAAEASWNCSMLPLCGFPEGIWFFY